MVRTHFRLNHRKEIFVVYSRNPCFLLGSSVFDASSTPMLGVSSALTAMSNKSMWHFSDVNVDFRLKRFDLVQNVNNTHYTLLLTVCINYPRNVHHGGRLVVTSCEYHLYLDRVMLCESHSLFFSQEEKKNGLHSLAFYQTIRRMNKLYRHASFHTSVMLSVLNIVYCKPYVY